MASALEQLVSGGAKKQSALESLVTVKPKPSTRPRELSWLNPPAIMEGERQPDIYELRNRKPLRTKPTEQERHPLPSTQYVALQKRVLTEAIDTSTGKIDQGKLGRLVKTLPQNEAEVAKNYALKAGGWTPDPGGAEALVLGLITMGSGGALTAPAIAARLGGAAAKRGAIGAAARVGVKAATQVAKAQKAVNVIPGAKGAVARTGLRFAEGAGENLAFEGAVAPLNPELYQDPKQFAAEKAGQLPSILGLGGAFKAGLGGLHRPTAEPSIPAVINEKPIVAAPKRTRKVKPVEPTPTIPESRIVPPEQVAGVEATLPSRFPDKVSEFDVELFTRHPELAREIASQPVDQYVADNQHLGTPSRLRDTHRLATEMVASAKPTPSKEVTPTAKSEPSKPAVSPEVPTRALEPPVESKGIAKKPWDMTQDEFLQQVKDNPTEYQAPNDVDGWREAHKRWVREVWLDGEDISPERYNEMFGKDYGEWGSPKFHENFPLVPGVPGGPMGEFGELPSDWTPDSPSPAKPQAEVEGAKPVKADTGKPATVPTVYRYDKKGRVVRADVKPEPVSKKTGLTKPQEEYLVDRLRTAVETTDTNLATGKFGEPVTIKVPGDGEFRVETQQQANALHQSVTGKPIADMPKEKLEPMSPKQKAPPPMHGVKSLSEADKAMLLYGEPKAAADTLRRQLETIKQKPEAFPDVDPEQVQYIIDKLDERATGQSTEYEAVTKYEPGWGMRTSQEQVTKPYNSAKELKRIRETQYGAEKSKPTRKSPPPAKPAPKGKATVAKAKAEKPAPTAKGKGEPPRKPLSTEERVKSDLPGMSTAEIKDAFNTGVADQYLKRAGWKDADIAKAKQEFTGKTETPKTYKVSWESETTSQAGDLGKTFPNEAAAKMAAADAKRKNPGRSYNVEEAEPGARSHIMEGLDAAEEAIRARRKARLASESAAVDAKLGSKRKQAGLAYNPTSDFVDAVELGAIKIAKGAVRIAEFTAEMVKEFGDTIRPYINKIYAAARSRYGRDYSTFDQFLQPLGVYDWQGKPIQKGVVDRLGTIINSKGELENVGSKAGLRIRQAERAMTRHTNQALRTVNRIVANVIAGVPGKQRVKAFSDFIDLIEKPFDNTDRIAAKAAGTPVGKALRLHDSMTERFRQYIIESRKSQGIETPDNWGITEQGYFRHLFLGDFEIHIPGEMAQRANTYAEAQGIVHRALKADPDAKVTINGRNMVFGDPTLRVSTGKYFRIAGNLADTVKIPLSEVMADIRGEIGRKSMKQKWSPYTLQRKGASGFSKEYANVMRMHAAQVSRTQELSKLNHEVQPMIEKIRSSGKSGLAEAIEVHLADLWGTPSRQDKLVGNFIRAHPKLADRVAAPDLALRGLARRLTALQFVSKLRLSPRAALMNKLQPYSTLWPFVSTKQYVSYQAAVTRPSIRKWMENLGVFDEAGKAEHTGLVGAHRKASWVAPWNWFQKASDGNRAMGFLHGYKTALAEGATKRQAIANGMSWAEKVEFDNSVWNIQAALRSPAGRVLGQFKSFMGKNLENAREVFAPSQPIPASQRAGRIGKWTATQTGVGGVRAFGAAATAAGGYKVYELLKGRLQEAGMDESDADKWAQAVYLGAPSLVGQDFSGSIMILEAPYGNTTAEKIANAFGPTVGTLAQMTDAVVARDWEKAARAITPATRQVKAASQLLKGDKATIKLGREEVELTDYEGVMRTLGFTPAKQTMFYEAREKPWWEGKKPKSKSSGYRGYSQSGYKP